MAVAGSPIIFPLNTCLHKYICGPINSDGRKVCLIINKNKGLGNLRVYLTTVHSPMPKLGNLHIVFIQFRLVILQTAKRAATVYRTCSMHVSHVLPQWLF
jgi:hypothetical protein